VTPEAQPEDPEVPPPANPQVPSADSTGNAQDPTPSPEPTSGEDKTREDNEPEVLVSEVLINGTESPELVNQVYDAIRTKAGSVTTRSQLQSDIDAVFSTGLFADVKAVPSDTTLGVRVTFDVVPNPVVNGVETEGSKLLPPDIKDKIFAEQMGKVLNFGDLQIAVQEVETWYSDNGYVLAKVVDVKTSADGVINLKIVEGEIEDIQVKGNTRTRDFIVTRELSAVSGEVFNREKIQQDIQKIFALNLFQDVNVSLDPGQDPNKVVVVVNVEERRTGSLGATAGVSSATGVFGGINLSEQNLGGNNQSASANIQIGTEEALFDFDFTDPRIATMEIPTSYNISVANRQSSSFVFDDGVVFANGDSVRINRFGGGVTFSRPIGDNWRASFGPQVEFVEPRDGDGNAQSVDSLGNPITFSPDGQDNYTSLRLGVVRDTRDNALSAQEGSLFRVSSSQSIGILENGLNSNRVEASYSQYIPVDILQTRPDKKTILAFDLKVGSVLGDLAPYDAFAIGGGNSVRGFFEGDIGSGRSYAQATTELRFPIFKPVAGVLFADYGTDLGSAAAVLGAPGIVRNKPGSGLGLGAGVRVQSPLGPLRIDYGLGQGSRGQSQLHFGIGEKF
jgi:outer membrane protein insertion porin family